jgi:hypothetical protein
MQKTCQAKLGTALQPKHVRIWIQVPGWVCTKIHTPWTTLLQIKESVAVSGAIWDSRNADFEAADNTQSRATTICACCSNHIIGLTLQLVHITTITIPHLHLVNESLVLNFFTPFGEIHGLDLVGNHQLGIDRPNLLAERIELHPVNEKNIRRVIGSAKRQCSRMFQQQNIEKNVQPGVLFQILPGALLGLSAGKISGDLAHDLVNVHVSLLPHGTGCDKCPVDGESRGAHAAVEQNSFKSRG